MLMAGVGFLLPYNSFITDVDYLHRKFKGKASCNRIYDYGDLITQSNYFSAHYGCQHLYPFTGTSIVFDMSLTYILVALSSVIVNNMLVEKLSLNTRICGGENLEKTYFALSDLLWFDILILCT